MGILLEGEEREKVIEEIFEVVIAENVPKLMTYTKPYTQEAQRMINRMNTKRSILVIQVSGGIRPCATTAVLGLGYHLPF